MNFRVVSLLLVLFFILMAAFYLFLTILFYVGFFLMAFVIISRSIASYSNLNELSKKLTYFEIALLLIKKTLRVLLSWESPEFTELKPPTNSQLPVKAVSYKEYQLEPEKSSQLAAGEALDSLNNFRLQYVTKLSRELDDKDKRL